MSAVIDVTRPAAKTSTVIADGHDMAPGDVLKDIAVTSIRPQMWRLIQDGELTTSGATIDNINEMAEAGAGLARMDERFTGVKTSDVPKTIPGFEFATSQSESLDRLTFESTNTPQAKATGVVVIIEARDSGANPLRGVNGFKVVVAVVGSGVSSAAASLTVEPFADSKSPDDDNIAQTHRAEIELKNGRAAVLITAKTAGEATISFEASTASRSGITLSDTQVVTLT